MLPGGLDRYIGKEPLVLEEGGTIVVGSRNLNVTGVAEYLNLHQRRGGGVVSQHRIRMQVRVKNNHQFTEASTKYLRVFLLYFLDL